SIASLEVELFPLATPFGYCEPRDIEVLGRILEQIVKVTEGIFDSRMHPLVDAVNVRVVGDGLEGNVRDGLIDEAAFQTFVWILQLEVVVAGGHQPLFGQGDSNTGGVTGDPAATLFLCNERGCTAPTSWIKYKVTRVGSHQYAARENLLICLDYISFILCGCGIIPRGR